MGKLEKFDSLCLRFWQSIEWSYKGSSASAGQPANVVEEDEREDDDVVEANDVKAMPMEGGINDLDFVEQLVELLKLALLPQGTVRYLPQAGDSLGHWEKLEGWDETSTGSSRQVLAPRI
jgi:hypothetical protein